MEKEIHFYFHRGAATKNVAVYYDTAMEELKQNKECIHTVQVVLLKKPLLAMKYRVFIHPALGDTFEIKLGNNQPYTDRWIKEEHNLLKLCLAGEFDTASTHISQVNYLTRNR